MILCLCHGVRENDVRAAIRGGCASVDAVGRACRAGTGCGSCRVDVRRLIEREEKPASLSEEAVSK